MLSALVTMNAESNGLLGIFISIMIFFVFLAVLSFIDNMETMLAASVLTTVVCLVLWFNAVVYFNVFMLWTLVTMLVGGYKVFSG